MYLWKIQFVVLNVLLAGEFDDLPEQAFMFVGTIEEAQEKAKKMAGE